MPPSSDSARDPRKAHVVSEFKIKSEKIMVRIAGGRAGWQHVVSILVGEERPRAGEGREPIPSATLRSLPLATHTNTWLRYQPEKRRPADLDAKRTIRPMMHTDLERPTSSWHDHHVATAPTVQFGEGMHRGVHSQAHASSDWYSLEPEYTAAHFPHSRTGSDLLYSENNTMNSPRVGGAPWANGSDPSYSRVISRPTVYHSTSPTGFQAVAESDLATSWGHHGHQQQQQPMDDHLRSITRHDPSYGYDNGYQQQTQYPHDRMRDPVMTMMGPPPTGIARLNGMYATSPNGMPSKSMMGSVHGHHRKAKEITIGRWNADEHKWFLKGLEMFQGPAWGEIARLIGTRTSTQVRTHAQKFFTKLARSNQTLPYFEVQIQKERSRLVSQGAAVHGGSSGPLSVTPTSVSGFNYALSTLSPRKRSTSPRPSFKRPREEFADNSSHRYNDQLSSPDYRGYEYETQQHTMARPMVPPSISTSFGYGSDTSPGGFFKPKFDHGGDASPLLRKPRILLEDAATRSTESAFTDQYQTSFSRKNEFHRDEDLATYLPSNPAAARCLHPHAHLSHSAPQPMMTSALEPSRDWVGGDWSGDHARQCASSPSQTVVGAETPSASSPQGSSSPLGSPDSDSLPSMDKLLYRSTTSSS